MTPTPANHDAEKREAGPVAKVSAAGTALIQMEGLGKTFPGVVALDDVDFDLRPGEVHALLGANGAGKSTLIKILSGYYTADAGRIRMEGKEVEIPDTMKARELGISVIYQDLALVPQLSVAENIFLGQERTGAAGLIDWPQTYAKASELLDLVGANFAGTARIRDLSTGQRQLVEIAKALSTKARVLILDEPTSALSQAEADLLFNLVRDLAAQGVGIVYVSHRLEEIEGLVDRVTVLRDGRSMGTFPARELDRARIVSLITGHDEPPEKLSSQSSRKPGDTVLELRDLTLPGSFEEVSLRVRTGEIVVMTGLLGAGRTEVLETVFGARAPSRGDIRLNGEPVRFSNPGDAIARGVALLPEDRRGQGVIEGLPIYKNLTLPSLGDFVGRFGLDIGREISRANQIIENLSIRTPGPTTLVRSLSGGNQQKVVVGKWLLTSARLILFDEPTQGLDVGAKDEIYGLLNSLVEEGKALLVVSSDMEEVLEIADRVIVMREGRVVGEFSGDGIRAEDMMAAITLGEAV